MADSAKTRTMEPANSSGPSGSGGAPADLSSPAGLSLPAGAAARGAHTSSRPPPKKMFKYPSEEETYVRRLGSAVLGVWPALTPELQQKILAEANLVWDREYNVGKLPQKLEAFVKRHPGRLS
jgi:hypothetical protein